MALAHLLKTNLYSVAFTWPERWLERQCPIKCWLRYEHTIFQHQRAHLNTRLPMCLELMTGTSETCIPLFTPYGQNRAKLYWSGYTSTTVAGKRAGEDKAKRKPAPARYDSARPIAWTNVNMLAAFMSRGEASHKKNNHIYSISQCQWNSRYMGEAQWLSTHAHLQGYIFWKVGNRNPSTGNTNTSHYSLLYGINANRTSITQRQVR